MTGNLCELKEKCHADLALVDTDYDDCGFVCSKTQANGEKAILETHDCDVGETNPKDAGPEYDPWGTISG